jgi:hypothetical protein
MMSKKIAYTNITPIPSFIPRQLAIDILHAHKEIIELNPLVIGHEGIKAPRDAPADEFYSTWYEISQRIQYIPGMGKLGSGKIKFKGVFHDMPWGLQTHIYAPANVDLRNKWRICGNQPGEPPETRELGLGAPPEGLYLREDIEIKANMTMVGFVKKETKAASKILVERLIKKAELLDSGALQAMMENGMLKTFNPADRSSHMPGPNSPHPSPKQMYDMPMSPTRQSTFPAQFAGQMGGISPLMGHVQPQMYSQMQGQLHPGQGQQYIPPQHSQGANNIVMEMEGDSYYHPEKSQNHLQPSPNHLSTDPRYSAASAMSGQSPNSNNGRWSQVSNDQTSLGSRPTSYNSEGMRSPGMEQKGFAAELPTTEETREEHGSAPKKLEGDRPYPDEKKYRYNPQDYANTQNPPPASAHPAHLSQHYSQQPQYQQQHPPQYTTYGPPGQR